MAFKIKHGGMVRYNAVIASTETVNFKKGHVLTLDSAGKAVVNTGTTTNVVGLAVDDRVVSTQFSLTADSNALAPSGQQAGLLMDEAVVVDDQVSGNSIFTVGAAVYIGNDGKLSDTNTNNRIIGRALKASTVGGEVEFFFSVQY